MMTPQVREQEILCSLNPLSLATLQVAPEGPAIRTYRARNQQVLEVAQSSGHLPFDNPTLNENATVQDIQNHDLVTR